MDANAQSGAGLTAEDRSIALLAAFAALPTAPLREEAVARFLVDRFQAFGFTLWQDAFGNLYARYRRGQPHYALALVAHMDHPGLLITRASEREVIAEVLGGIAPTVLAPGTAVSLYAAGETIRGEVTYYLPAAGGFRPSVSLEVEGEAPVGALGMLDLPTYTRVGDYLALRVADDLAQCACATLVAERLTMSDAPADVTFLFTRAEEIGLIGATLAAQSGSLPAGTVVISLECSRALPGAEIGQGAVIRVGDASMAFHPEGEALLLTARDQLLMGASRDPSGGRQVQRQLMSGGSCEASSFSAFGYTTTGMVLPLGNYHNADSNGQAAPEFIHLHDLMAGVDLLLAAIAVSAQPLPDRRSRLSRIAATATARLVESTQDWRLGLPSAPEERREDAASLPTSD